MLICVGILFGLIFGWYFLKQQKIAEFMSNFKAPATTVSATKAVSETWQPYLTAVGNLEAINGVSVSPQTSGTIDKISFKSGTVVNKGDPLIHIDSRVEEADLMNYNAQYKLAKLNYDRDVKLLAKGAVSKSAVDTDQASLQEALANVESTKVQIAYKNVTAPFSGKIGIKQVNVGQYIEAGDEIASLQSLDPLYVSYTLPEQQISKLKVGQAVEVTTDSYPDQTYQGTINALDSEVTSETASISVQATIPNKDTKLLPGMFATIHTMLPEDGSVIAVPETSISYNLYGDSVYIVEETKDKQGNTTQTAKLQYVTVGDRQGSQVAITKGVKAGDMVVTSGQIKLNNGAQVKINNEVQP